MGWKWVGWIESGVISLRRTGWPIPHAGRP